MWEKITSAPKDGTPILVTNESAGSSWIAYYEERYQSGYRPENPWSSLMLNVRYLNDWSLVPTHWMSLPRL